MSNKPSTSERPLTTQDTEATGVFEAPAPTPSLTEADTNVTGAYVLPDAAAANQEQTNGSAKHDNTELLPPELGGATAILLPPAAQAERDATTVLPGAALSGPSSTPPPDATMDGATGIYEPDLSAPTCVYEQGSTQAPAKQDTVNRAHPHQDATGVYEAGKPGGAAASADEGGATHGYDPASLAGTASTQEEAAPPHRCGRYLLKRFHAKGGMGEIWLADDPEIGRSVALKKMLTNRADQQRRFRVEAQVTGQLEHPGIVPIHELGVNEEGQPFYVMKFVHGRTLQKVIDEYHAAKRSPGDQEVEQFRLLQIFTSLCQTVAYAHSRGVLHRDLKPENVMLGPYGETLLLDWGIAKVMGQPEKAEGEIAAEAEYVHLLEDGPDSQTRAGTIMGSLSFMSPEVAFGKNAEVDQRSDVYLLGGILYTILTGRPPRRGKNAMELIKQAQTEMPPTPRKVNTQVSKPLDAICIKALALRKEDRYQSALALAEDIQRYAAGESVSAYREGFAERSWRWAKRHRAALTRVAAAALIGCLIVFGAIKYRAIENERLKTVQENEHLQKLEQARGEVKQFRALADEARFYAATTDPVAEHAPYFNPREAEIKANAARDVAANWGPALEQLPLPEERESLRKDLYDLLLLLAQSKLQQETNQEAGREALALLHEAEPLRDKPSRGLYRLRADAYQRLDDQNGGTENQELATAQETPETAQDLFLRGEQYRTASVGKGKGEKVSQAWQPDPQRMQKAIEQYRQALEKDPDHYWSYFQLGRCYLALGRFSEAGEALGACVALRKDSPWGYSVRGFALAQQQRYQEAETDLNKAVQLSQGSLPPLLNRGVVYWLQKKNKEAMDDFDAILTAPKEKRLIEAAFYRGQLYLQLGKMKEALGDFNLVVQENPNFRPVYLHRARIYIANGDNASARNDLTKYLSLSNEPPFEADSWEGHGKRGHLLRFLYAELPQEQRDKPANQALLGLAVMEMKRAVALGGRDPRIYDDLGTVLYLSGAINDAIAAFSDGLKLAPKDALLLTARGWLYVAANKFDKALTDFVAACQVDPKNAEAHSGLGYVRAFLKAHTEAQQEAQLAVLHGTEKYLVLHNVACIYSTLSQAGDAHALAHQDVAMDLLRLAVQVWKRDGETGLNEIELMKEEPAFQPLRERPDFKALVGEQRKP